MGMWVPGIYFLGHFCGGLAEIAGVSALSPTGSVYGASGSIRVIKVLVVSLAVAGILVGYRFLLFLITLYSI